MSNQKYCQYCGAELKENEKYNYCPKCGEKLISSTNESESPEKKIIKG